MRTLLLIFLVVVSAACNGPKKQMKHAAMLEEGGLKQEAFQKYDEIYQHYSKPEARIAMKRTAQSMADAKFQTARMHCMQGNHEQALDEFNQAIDYINAHRDLELQMSPGTDDAIANCKAEYISELYNEAEKLALEEKYDDAKINIRKIYAIDRNNKKAQYLELLCEILPNYNEGMMAYELGLYRDAYFAFNEVTRLDAAYKDALKLRDECLSKSKFTLAYLHIENNKEDRTIQASISTAIKGHILSLRSPFAQLLDRDDLDQLLKEQASNMGGLYDANNAIEAGKLVGARYLITGQLIQLSTDLSPTRGTEKKGFEGNSISGRKIKYTEYNGSLSISATFRYQIIDAETGQVYASEIIPYNNTQVMSWAKTGGPTQNIYPGEWKFQIVTSKSDYVDESGYEKLQELFNNASGELNEAEAISKMVNAIGEKVAEAVRNFKP